MKIIRTILLMFIVVCLALFGGVLLLASLLDDDQPKTPNEIARAVTDDPKAAVTITEDNLTILFTFPSTQTARQDALRIFPTLLCDFRELGYTNHTYRIMGTAVINGTTSPGISSTLSPQEVAAYPCGQVGQIDFDISPELP